MLRTPFGLFGAFGKRTLHVLLSLNVGLVPRTSHSYPITLPDLCVTSVNYTRSVKEIP